MDGMFGEGWQLWIDKITGLSNLTIDKATIRQLSLIHIYKIKAQKPEEAESAMGYFGKIGQYLMQSNMTEVGQVYDAQDIRRVVEK